MNINYPIVTDGYSYEKKIGGIYVVPTTYILDRQGFITARKTEKSPGYSPPPPETTGTIMDFVKRIVYLTFL